MNSLVLLILDELFMARDNLLGVFGFGFAVYFVTMLYVTGDLSFFFLTIAGAIVSMMGGLRINFGVKEKKQIKNLKLLLNKNNAFKKGLDG